MPHFVILSVLIGDMIDHSSAVVALWVGSISNFSVSDSSQALPFCSADVFDSDASNFDPSFP